MGRRLRAAAGALWVVPALAVGAVWVRSCQTMDEWSGVSEGNVLRAVVSYRGAVHWVRAERNSTARPWGWDSYDVPAGATWAELYALEDLDWRHAGFAKLSAPKAAAPATPPAMVVVPPPATRAPTTRRQRRMMPASSPAQANAPADAAPAAPPPAAPPPAAAPIALTVKVRQKIAPWLFTLPYVAYAIPYWPALAVTSVPALRVVVRLVSRRRRRRRGLCPGCGYDLRAAAAGGRCPECGEALAPRREEVT